MISFKIDLGKALLCHFLNKVLLFCLIFISATFTQLKNDLIPIFTTFAYLAYYLKSESL